MSFDFGLKNQGLGRYSILDVVVLPTKFVMETVLN